LKSHAEVRGGAENRLLGRVFRGGAESLSIHSPKCKDFGVGIQPYAATRSRSVLRDQRVRVVEDLEVQGTFKESDPLKVGRSDPCAAAKKHLGVVDGEEHRAAA